MRITLYVVSAFLLLIVFKAPMKFQNMDTEIYIRFGLLILSFIIVAIARN